MKKIYRIMVIAILCSTSVFAQSLSNAEYFYDNDPGVGNGTAITMSAADSVDFNVNLTTVGLNPGFHTLSIRVQNTSGVWSLYYSRNFYISTHPASTVPQIVKAEYFYDTDPGVGNGTIITPSFTAADSVDTIRNASTVGLPSGLHSLMVRTQNSYGVWSFAVGDTFTVSCPYGLSAGVINGLSSVCIGSPIVLTDTATGGVWSSSNSAVATVDSSGNVTGVLAGTASISYAVTNGCGTTAATAVITVNGTPMVTSVSPIMGYPGSVVTITGTNFNTTAADDIVFFGATQASVSSASSNSLTVTVPSGATYTAVSVLNAACALTRYSDYPFLPTYNNSAYVPDVLNFNAGVTFATGSSPHGVAIGDIDGDGKPDLVVVNEASNNVSVYFNTSSSGSITSGSFAAPVSFATGYNSTSVAIGDIDGDGKPDLAVTSFGSNTVSVLRNTSSIGGITTSSFATAVSFGTGSEPFNVAIGDIDGDGKADLVVANFGSSNVSVLRNTSSIGGITTSSFATAVSFATGSYPYSVAIADIDGDGKPDVAVANEGSNNVSVLRNTSSSGSITTSSFATQVTFATGTHPYSLAIGDIDGDGKPDLVVTNNSSNTVSVLRNTSSSGSITSGSFATQVTFISASPTSVVIGDIDGDGKPDLAVTNFGYNSVSVLRNMSSIGSITSSSFASQVTFATGSEPFGVAIGDIDGDGKPDLAVTNFSYTSNTVSVFLNDPLGFITGSTAVCAGSTVALNETTTNGTWSISGTTATVNSSGVVTGVLSGTATVTYTVSGGYTTAIVTVNPLPNAGSISGAATVCVGATTNLSDGTVGGVWRSSNGSASVGSESGIVTGVSAGTATISYTVTNGCGSASATMVVTVNNTTSAGTITGPSSVNTGSNITLTDAVSGGAWSASNANATVSAGVVTGVTAGSVTISYAVTGGCGPVVATKVITVSTASLPGINGSASICGGGTTTLTDGTTGGTWSSSNGAVATIGGTSGIVTGVAAGTTNITYTQGGAYTTVTFTVNAMPLPIQGATSECAGTTITVSDNTAGGTWSSSGDVSVAALGTNSGTVTAGASAGVGAITYTLNNGCSITYPNTVIANPSAIFGAMTVCVGAATVLSDSTVTAVSWTSSNTLVATVAITGHVTGVASGTVTITYKASSGCIATTMVTVTTASGAITGNGPVCAGSAVTLSDVWGAGTWNSSSASIATVGSGSGIVTGVTNGTATITYYPGIGGCISTAAVTVSAAPAISGNTNVCAGTTTTLSDVSTGGTWSSSNTGVATVGLTTGVVTGVSAGSSTITYTLVSGCMRTITVNVVGSMSPIAGTTSLCASATATLSDVTGGGTWSSSNTLMASVGTSGLVTASAVNTGTVTISYSGGGCVATTVLTVSANPKPIQGAISECAGTIVTLSDATAGGTWSITGDASISGTGVLTSGAVAGTATVTYTIGTGCFITYPNTVIKNPSAIFGAFTVCAGSVTILSDSSATGVSWASSNTLAATVAVTGHVTGVASGTAIITYKALPGNCIATAIVTVNAAPAMTPITGPTSIAEGTPATLTEATGGGIWSSSNTSKITLSGSAGSPITATAVALSGSSVISYVVTNGFGCSATATLTITSTSPPHATGVNTPGYTSEEVLLYPNPTNGSINIRADVAGVFYLYSLDGKTLGAYKISEGITSVNLTNELAVGIYMGRYVSDDGNVTLFKVVKE